MRSRYMIASSLCVEPVVFRNKPSSIGPLAGPDRRRSQVKNSDLRSEASGGTRLDAAIALDSEGLDRSLLWLPTTKGDRQGNRILHRQAQRRFAGWCEAAEIRRVSLHELRHSFAVGLYRETRDHLAPTIPTMNAALDRRSMLVGPGRGPDGRRQGPCTLRGRSQGGIVPTPRR